MVNGDIDKILEGQKKHLDNFEKQIKAGALKNTPKPVGDSIGNSPLTKEVLKKMTPLERFEIYTSDPEKYKEAYGGN